MTVPVPDLNPIQTEITPLVRVYNADASTRAFVMPLGNEFYTEAT